MSEDESVSQAEMNNLLLHQKTEYRLQEVDKTMERIYAKTGKIMETLASHQRRTEDGKQALKKEIEEDFVTKADFITFANRSEEQWKKLHWMLSGALIVLLGGGWVLNQYSVVNKILNSQSASIEQAVTKAMKEKQHAAP